MVEGAVVLAAGSSTAVVVGSGFTSEVTTGVVTGWVGVAVVPEPSRPVSHTRPTTATATRAATPAISHTGRRLVGPSGTGTCPGRGLSPGRAETGLFV